MYGNNYGRVEPVKTVQERLKEQYEKAVSGFGRACGPMSSCTFSVQRTVERIVGGEAQDTQARLYRQQLQ